MQILVVDDEALVRKYIIQSISDALPDNGKDEVVEVPSGSLALEYVQSNPVDLMFVDITMPKVTGLDVLKGVKAINPDVDVVMLTCHEDFAFAKEAIQEKAHDYILKKEIDSDFFKKYLEKYREEAEKTHRYSALFSQKMILATIKGMESNWKDCVDELNHAIVCIDTEGVGFKNAKLLLLQFLYNISDQNSIDLESNRAKAEKLINVHELKQCMHEIMGILNLQRSGYSVSMEEAVAYILNHYTEELSLKKVADAVYLNSDYLSRLFKKEMGINFSEYIQKLRLKQAELLIKNTTIRISEIAIQVGFSSFSHFSTAFSKVYGYAPSKIRR